MGENNPEAYQIHNASPAIGSGFLINGSTDTTNYLEHNGGLDYFGNSVSHNSASNIGAFNGSIDNLSQDNIPDEQVLDLPSGWSMFSTYMLADEMVLDAVLDSILPNVIIVKDYLGFAFIPEFNYNGLEFNCWLGVTKSKQLKQFLSKLLEHT